MTPSAALIRNLVDSAIAAERALADLGETIDDEWSYVNDLDAAWSARLEDVALRRAEETAPAAVAEAIGEAIAETESIRDPHRAIDWLSTFPQVVLLALGEPA
jgi:hypothetical protein